MLNHPLSIISGLLFGSLFATGSLYFFWQVVKAKSSYFEVEEKHRGNQRWLKIIGVGIFALALIWVNNQNKINLASSHTPGKVIALNTNKPAVNQSTGNHSTRHGKTGKIHEKSKSGKTHKAVPNHQK